MKRLLWILVREFHSPRLPFSPIFTIRFQTTPRYWPRLFSVWHAIILSLLSQLLPITSVKPTVTQSQHPTQLQRGRKLAKRLLILSLRGLLLVIRPTQRALTARKHQISLQTLANVPLWTKPRQATKSTQSVRPANAQNHVKFILMQSLLRSNPSYLLTLTPLKIQSPAEPTKKLKRFTKKRLTIPVIKF